MANIKYHPVHIFPNNPVLHHFIEKKEIKDEFENGLVFEFGPNGKLSILVPSHPMFIDRTSNKPQIILEIKTTDSSNTIDLTNQSSELIVFGDSPKSLYDNVSFYVKDGKVVSNYDFSNDQDKKSITLRYSTITKNLKVKAVLISSTSSANFSTPAIDQYTLVIGKQK